jgi:TonB family protein
MWLAHLGLFAGLLWLSRESPTTEAKHPLETKWSGCQFGPKPKPLSIKLVAKPKPPPDSECPLPDTGDVCGHDVGPWGDAIPFNSPTMIPPKLVSVAPLEYTPEARAARVQGFMIAKCTITCRGEVRNCRILRPLPHMEAAAISSLESRRYSPALYDGRPVSVSYLFNIKVSPP